VKFKDFKLPESEQSWVYADVRHQDLFEHPTIFKVALRELLGATYVRSIIGLAALLFSFL
jgi:hypothetical protein